MAIENSLYLGGCTINRVGIEQTNLTIEAESNSTMSNCLDCNQPSTRVHSYRVRSIRDLPINEYIVNLKIQIKRFHCLYRSCARQTWTETIPEIVERYSRRTKRLTTTLWHIAQVVGGNPGSRLTTVVTPFAKRFMEGCFSISKRSNRGGIW